MSKGRTGAILASAGALLLAGAVPAFGQVRGAVATASAEICQPVSIQKPADLNFGGMIATRSAGQVVLGQDGARRASGCWRPSDSKGPRRRAGRGGTSRGARGRADPTGRRAGSPSGRRGTAG